MKKSSKLIFAIVAFAVGALVWQWGASLSYTMPLPITHPENLTYARIDNYENNTVKFITQKEDIIKVGEILNSITVKDSAENKDSSIQFIVVVSDGKQTKTYSISGQYIASEGHWFNYEGADAAQSMKNAYSAFNYEEKVLSK